MTQRRTDDEHREEIRGCLDQAHDRRLDRVEHGILHHEVVDRVAGEAQLGEHRDGDGSRRRTRAAVASTASALVAGSAIETGIVHAATRANPCR